MLSPEQLEQFERDGLTVAPRAIAPADVLALRERVWAHLAEAHGVREGESSTWSPARPSHFRALTRSLAFEALRSPSLEGALDQLLGSQAWIAPAQWGPPLVSFPDAASWDVPARDWHLDIPIAPSPEPTAVRAFAFLTDVRPRGGGTAAVAGSHRVLERLAAQAGRTLRSAEARKALRACDPWFAALETPAGDDRVRLMRPGAAALGLPVRVVELCADAGDVILMRAELLHARAPHALPAPRFVLAPIIFRAGAPVASDPAPLA